MIHPKINFPKLLFFKIIIPQFFPENFPKVFPQNLCFQIPLQNRYIKAVIHCQKRFLKPIFQNNPRKKIGNYSPKLYSENIPQKCSPFKTAVQSCRIKLLLKIISNPQKYFPKLFQKIITQSPSPKLSLPAAPSNYPPKLLKLSQKLFPKATSKIFFLMLFPKISIFQSNLSSILVQNRISKKFPKKTKLFSEIISKLVRNIDQN